MRIYKKTGIVYPHKEGCSCFRCSGVAWNKGIKGIHLNPKNEIKKGQHVSKATEIKKGQRLSPETEFKKGALSWSRINADRMPRGEDHPMWQGGKSVINKTERLLEMQTHKYREWRRSVFERDNYSCQTCGARNGNGIKVVLHADHVKPWALYPKLRYDLNNGRTLCVTCHRKTDTWGGKIFKGVVSL